MSIRPLSLALVSLPWSHRDRPSAALGVLSAFVRKERPEWNVSTHHLYVDFAERLGADLYKHIASHCHQVGELLALQLLYPSKTASIRGHFEAWHKGIPAALQKQGNTFDRLSGLLSLLVERTAQQLAGTQLVGFTTSYAQLFLNLKVAQRLKEMSPTTQVILGGMTLAGRVGPSIMREYPWIEFIVQGEGERPLVSLLDAVAAQRVADCPIPGVLRRLPSGEDVVQRPEPAPFDDLPPPNYEEYVALAEQHNVVWSIPIQGSRGCWWNRTAQTKNTKSICQFCTVNTQYERYRERSIPRIVAEMDQLSCRYRNVNFIFVDDVLRTKGVKAFSQELMAHRRDYQFFHEIRASITPYELFLLKEAGLKNTQMGIEGLSTAYLRRIGKGTSTIQNLQALRTCAELRITSQSNLLTEFPGTTQEEIEETRRNILDFAISYEPLNISKFALFIDTAVDKVRQEVGITNVRNREMYRVGMPDDVWRRINTYELDFDSTLPSADWSPVHDACEQWKGSYYSYPENTLSYQDGETFLNIFDRRGGGLSEVVLDEQDRDLYLFCTEIRSFDQLLKRYTQNGGSEAILKDTLKELCTLKLMFQEGNQYLSLAVAISPEHAKRRYAALQIDSKTAAA